MAQLGVKIRDGFDAKAVPSEAALKGECVASNEGVVGGEIDEETRPLEITRVVDP